MMSDIRESIKKQLESSYLIDMLARAVLDFNDTDLKCIASLCRQDYTALTIKINMLKKKKSYLDKKEKMEIAVKDVFHKIDYLSVAAFKHELDIEELEKVFHNWLNSEDSVSYEYDEDKNGIFTFVEESLLFKQLYRWEKNCNKCSCQVCAMEQLQSIAYFIAKKKNKCPQTWLKCEKADLSWLSNFIMEYIEEIFKLNGPDECIIDSQTSSTLQPFIFNRQIEEISDLIILYPHVQNKPSQLSNVQVISDIREKIVRHLEISPWLNKAAKKVLYENKNITDVALEYNLDFWIFKRKLEIIKETNIYVNVKNKYENAICTIVNQNASLNDSAKTHCINRKHLKAELIKYLQLRRKTRESYKYDQIIKPNGIFTASQERSLLQLLNSWKRCFKCSCQVCIMEHLLKLTYSFAKMNKILYPSEWDINEEADEFWFCEFEMRYSIEIKTQFVFAHSCTKEPSASQLPSSFIQPKTLEINTLHAQMQEDFEPLQLSNADVTKNDNVQKRIATHLKLSRLLDEAAEKVLNKNKYIASVAQDYKLDLWLLNRKVYILKFQRIQLDTKNKIESSLNDIKYNNISVSCAAKKYNIDEEIIETNWQQWRMLESNIFIYDAFTMDDEIFTFLQESLLLEQLQENTKNLNCNCQICVLEYLRSMAYSFATQTIGKRCPVEWHAIAKADELWIYEFEMRHSIEISKYRQCDHLDCNNKLH